MKLENSRLKTCITDHNNAGLSNFVTVFSIDCGEDTGPSASAYEVNIDPNSLQIDSAAIFWLTALCSQCSDRK